MCGEHLAVRSPLRMDSGSSPHVRGALQLPVDFRHIAGIIPACAGSTLLIKATNVRTGDHPRMCGEHRCRAGIARLCGGSSPHVRGALPILRQNVARTGIIPACAGSTLFHLEVSHLTGDHPRMCGEHGVAHRFDGFGQGSSPHVRGAHRTPPQANHRNGIIPACAGSTGGMRANVWIVRDHPRMCGEHATLFPQPLCCAGSSPHVRGALPATARAAMLSGIIPACAGSTLRK